MKKFIITLTITLLFFMICQLEAKYQVERTFALIKPHAITEKKIGKILTMIETADFSIVAIKKIQLTEQDMYDLYMHDCYKPFFPEYLKRMTAGPVIALVLEKKDAVAQWAKYKWSVRKSYGVNSKYNAVHGSDNIIDAQREIPLFFPDL